MLLKRDYRIGLALLLTDGYSRYHQHGDDVHYVADHIAACKLSTSPPSAADVQSAPQSDVLEKSNDINNTRSTVVLNCLPGLDSYGLSLSILYASTFGHICPYRRQNAYL
jgi:hypothetical protein